MSFDIAASADRKGTGVIYTVSGMPIHVIKDGFDEY